MPGHDAYLFTAGPSLFPPTPVYRLHVVSRSKYFTLFLLSLNLWDSVTQIIWKVFIINLWKPDFSLMGCFSWDYIKRPESQTCISRNNPPEKWGGKWLPTSQIYSLEFARSSRYSQDDRDAQLPYLQYNPGFYVWLLQLEISR